MVSRHAFKYLAPSIASGRRRREMEQVVTAPIAYCFASELAPLSWGELRARTTVTSDSDVHHRLHCIAYLESVFWEAKD